MRKSPVRIICNNTAVLLKGLNTQAELIDLRKGMRYVSDVCQLKAEWGGGEYQRRFTVRDRSAYSDWIVMESADSNIELKARAVYCIATFVKVNIRIRNAIKKDLERIEEGT
jgi:hypothetical protein